ncbi:MAG: IS1380 family transposase [Nitrospirota bacterium]
MRDDSTTQSVLFPSLADRPVIARFDEPHSSSDGGAVLVKAIDQRLRLTARLAACLPDAREPGKVVHPLVDLVRQRVFGLICGYADANDAARLAHDPVHKLLLDRDPVDGGALASQPTLSRFENAVGPKDLLRLGTRLADAVIAHHEARRQGRARRITIDLDPTDDPTHGAQQLALFNGHYGTWCYLPLLGFVRFDDEAEQSLFAAVLRPGTASRQGVSGLLLRVITRLRGAFPQARLLVRLDGGLGSPDLLDRLDAVGVDYVIGLPSNAVLERRAQKALRKARRRARETGQTATGYTECRYAATTWSRRRRVVIKAEVVAHPGRALKDNPRFVVTNRPERAKAVYEQLYCYRGEIENRIKELLHGLEVDRTSCSRFWANQFRVLLTAAAYVLLQELRRYAAHTACARAQVTTLRERLLKLGARVVVSVRRIVLHLPASAPFRDAWRQVALAVGARAG